MTRCHRVAQGPPTCSDGALAIARHLENSPNSLQPLGKADCRIDVTDDGRETRASEDVKVCGMP